MPILPDQQDRDAYLENCGGAGHPKHPTYYNKPKPAMQAISQHAHFNDNTRASLAYESHVDAIRNPDLIPAVPTTWDTVYDPDHPDADWTGLVPKSHIHKKHVNDHVSLKENIERSEFGIVSKEERKGDFIRKRSPEDNSIVSKNTQGSIIIGGIDNPEERWRTTHQRMDARLPTYRDQLAMDKQVSAVKRTVNPSFARSGANYGASSSYHAGAASETLRAEPAAASSLRPSAMGYSARNSFLNGIGDKLSIEPPARTTPSARPPSETGKLLITDNYRAFAPGYTGARKS